MAKRFTRTYVEFTVTFMVDSDDYDFYPDGKGKPATAAKAKRTARLELGERLLLADRYTGKIGRNRLLVAGKDSITAVSVDAGRVIQHEMLEKGDHR